MSAKQTDWPQTSDYPPFWQQGLSHLCVFFMHSNSTHIQSILSSILAGRLCIMMETHTLLLVYIMWSEQACIIDGQGVQGQLSYRFSVATLSGYVPCAGNTFIRCSSMASTGHNIWVGSRLPVLSTYYVLHMCPIEALRTMCALLWAGYHTLLCKCLLQTYLFTKTPPFHVPLHLSSAWERDWPAEMYSQRVKYLFIVASRG